MDVVPIDAERPDDGELDRAATVLSTGGIVALPTETFYALAGDALRPDVRARVNRLKGKPPDSPILVLIGDRKPLARLLAVRPPGFDLLADRYWPGPLTLVVPASDAVPRAAGVGRATVGIRLPGLACTRAVARRFGGAITGVSANPHGHPPARTAGDVCREFGERLELVLDGGTTAGGSPSTVVDLSRREPRVLREGRVPGSELRSLLADHGLPLIADAGAGP